MKIIKKTYLFVLLFIALIGCKKYESFVEDFDYSTTYFASQKPLRTIVGYENMTFKIGVTMGGVRENKTNQTVTYQIDPTLLTTVAGASNFRLLPANYYTISNASTMIIPAGKNIGEVTVTLNRNLFTADPDALNNVYALPLRIVSSSTDSVLRGGSGASAKDYTILVVKYISPFHGTYYHKGVETVGTTNTSYTNKDLSQNLTWDLSTLGLNVLRTPGAGTRATPTLRLVVNNDNSVTVNNTSATPVVTGTGTYSLSNKAFYLNYAYTSGTSNFSIKDTLILRQAPELDLRFQEW